MFTPKSFDYATLQAMHNDGNKELINIANNTISKCVYNLSGEIARFEVYYHGTRIAHVFQDEIQLFNGGYFTSTTKERINWLLNPIGYTCYQKDFTWFISGKDFDFDNPVKFREGMIIEY